MDLIHDNFQNDSEGIVSNMSEEQPTYLRIHAPSPVPPEWYRRQEEERRRKENEEEEEKGSDSRVVIIEMT
jgi:hypothetical protein